MANLRTNNLSGEGGRNAYRGSVFFDGDDDYIDLSSDSALAASIPGGDEAYTIEMWVLFGRGGSEVDSGGSDSLIAYGSNSTRSYNGIDWTGTAIRNVWYGDDLSYTVNLTDGAWHHVAATYDQTTRRLFVDGVLGASDTPSDHSVGTTNNGKIGASTGGVVNRDFKGYISNLRITKRAIYTAAFIPPTQELTADDDDVMLLCCQDSNDPSQEATGKTITGNGNLATAGYLETQPKVIPPYGVDAGNTFNGAISMNSPSYMCFPTGRKEERGRGRVIVFGNSSVNSSFEMATGGKATKFGNANFTIADQHASCSSSTRAVRLNGYSPSTAPIACNVMEFVTIATESNATDFGDSTRACRYSAGFGSQTRGLNANGNTPGAKNVIDYITIASTGNAIDFGDLSATFDGTLAGATSNSTRGLINGCEPGKNVTEYVTIATTGNAQDFGDSTVAMEGRKGAADSTRALFASGYSHPTFQTINTIDYFTIATTGNAVDFGDMTYISGAAGGTSDSTRAVFMGGFTSPGQTTDTIDVVTIQTTGDAVEFGDMYAAGSTADAATSDSHGGIS